MTSNVARNNRQGITRLNRTHTLKVEVIKPVRIKRTNVTTAVRHLLGSK